MKEWEKRIDDFLTDNSSEPFIGDDQLTNLIIELTQTESLSPIQKSNLLKRQSDSGLTLAILAPRSKNPAIQQWLTFSGKLFDVHARLNIIDQVLSKDSVTYNQIEASCQQISHNNLLMDTIALVTSHCDTQGFASTFLGSFVEDLKTFDTQTTQLSAIATRHANFSQQLTELKNSIELLFKSCESMNIGRQYPAVLQKLSNVRRQCDALSQKISATQQKHSSVSQKSSRSRTHYLIAAQNIANNSSNKDEDITSDTIKRALALMGFRLSDNTATASNASRSSSKCPTLGEMLDAIQTSEINEDIFTASPPDPEVIYKALTSLAAKSSGWKKISADEAKAMLSPHTQENIPANITAYASSSTSSSSTSTLPATHVTATRPTSSQSSSSTSSTSSSRLDEFKERIDSLLDSSVNPINDQRLVSLLNDLADANSLSATEKFALLKHTARDSKPRVLTMHVGTALYFKDTVTKKLVDLLKTAQRFLKLDSKGLQLARHINYPYFNYDSILEYEAPAKDPHSNEIIKKLFEFLTEIGFDVRPNEHRVFSVPKHLVGKFYTALCRLCLTDKDREATDQHRVAHAEDFDIYYYYQIADSGESFTEAEQKQLASYADFILQYILTFQDKEKKAALERCVNPTTSLGKIFLSSSNSDSLDRAHFELNALTKATTVGPTATASQPSSSTSSNSSSRIASLTGNSNKKRINEFTQRINGLLDASDNPNNAKQLIILLNDLASADSLSAAEKFELFQCTARNGKPQALTFHVGAALYFKTSVTKKLVASIKYVLDNDIKELLLAIDIAYPRHPNEPSFRGFFLPVARGRFAQIRYQHIKDNLLDEFMHFYVELGILKREQGGLVSFLPASGEFDKFLIAMCRLHLSYEYSDANAKYFVSYYYKIANSGESFTEVEQKRLASYTDLILEHILTFQDKEKQSALERCVNPTTSLGKIFLSSSTLNETRLKLNDALTTATTIAPTATASQSSSSSSSSSSTSAVSAPAVSTSATSATVSLSSSSSGSSSASTTTSTPNGLMQSLSQLFRSVAAASTSSNNNNLIPQEPGEIEMADLFKLGNNDNDNDDDDDKASDLTSKLEKSR